MAIDNRLLECYQPRPSAKARLFCFPYAGGGALMYADWVKYLPETIEMCVIQLPGRENRIAESPFAELDVLISSVAEGIRAYLNLPFAFFGHSMGALISFELARLIRYRNMKEPVHLFVSGFRAPHLLDPDAPIHNLPKEEFVKELQKLGGTPETIMDYPELLEMMLPVIRSDIALCETYKFVEMPLLSCPVSAYGGLQDSKLSKSQIEAWHELTAGEFDIAFFPGNHFFFQESKKALIESIVLKINKII